MAKKTLSLICVIVLCLCVSTCAAAAESSGTERYFDLVEQGILYGRSQMPVMVSSAEEAAKRIAAGGSLYAAETGNEFCSEAFGRAGGLMFLKPITINGKCEKKDVILIGITGKISGQYATAIAKWRESGGYVIAFASGADSIEPNSMPDALVKNGRQFGLAVRADGAEKLCPVDSLMNLASMWSWTGEFISASTRLGKMPVMYQSIGIAGGIVRNDKYTGKTFHDDITINPIAPAVLGQAYFDSIQYYLRSVRNTELSKIKKASGWCAKASPERSTTLVIGHAFPMHFQDMRAPQRGLLKTTGLVEQNEEFSSGEFVILCGYQAGPDKLAIEAEKKRFKFVYFTVGEAGSGDNVIYINPKWPVDDGCVSVPGYDVPVLPPSGVVNAAIYWSIMAQVYDR